MHLKIKADIIIEYQIYFHRCKIYYHILQIDMIQKMNIIKYCSFFLYFHLEQIALSSNELLLIAFAFFAFFFTKSCVDLLLTNNLLA